MKVKYKKMEDQNIDSLKFRSLMKQKEETKAMAALTKNKIRIFLFIWYHTFLKVCFWLLILYLVIAVSVWIDKHLWIAGIWYIFLLVTVISFFRWKKGEIDNE